MYLSVFVCAIAMTYKLLYEMNVVELNKLSIMFSL